MLVQKEHQVMRVEGLMAQLGGNLGLFMGFSVMTLFEWFEFFLLMFSVRRRRNKFRKTPAGRKLSKMYSIGEDTASDGDSGDSIAGGGGGGGGNIGGGGHGSIGGGGGEMTRVNTWRVEREPKFATRSTML